MTRKIGLTLLAAIIGLFCVYSTAGAIDWKQLQGTEIRFLMNKHPFTTSIQPKVAEFEKMTGIKVNLEVFPEDQFRNKRLLS